ncbi:MAG: hypothetical protein ACLRNQ_06245 [Flavonifractor plautii]
MSLESKYKDMESVLALLPQEKEFVTEDGLSGTLALQLDTVQVEAAGYGGSTREVSATRSYPNLASQDTANIPKSIEEDGRTLTLQSIDWRTDNTANVVRLRHGRPLYRRGHLHRHRNQQLCHRLHRHGGLHRHRQPHRLEPGTLCGHL